MTQAASSQSHAGATPKINVFAPLSDFPWHGGSFSIPGFCRIERSDIAEIEACENLLSDLHKAELEELRNASHWLAFEHSSDDALTKAEKINIFLLALWLSCPTRTQIRLRFELPPETDGSQDHSRSVARLLDRFKFVEDEVQYLLEGEHLNQVVTYVDPIKAIYAARQRLWNSLVLTFYGCTTIHWQAAVICFSAAAEGILTYKKGFGITERLAKSFACLTQATTPERDAAYQAFVHSYSIRGDIMHGRAGDKQKIQDNRKELVQWSSLLRTLWKTVLTSSVIMTELEKADNDRELWFTHREAQYQPPKI